MPAFNVSEYISAISNSGCKIKINQPLNGSYQFLKHKKHPFSGTGRSAPDEQGVQGYIRSQHNESRDIIEINRLRDLVLLDEPEGMSVCNNDDQDV